MAIVFATTPEPPYVAVIFTSVRSPLDGQGYGEVVTPEDYLGNITADLSSRRALIDRTSTRGKLMVIDARAPLEKMFGYSTAVRSLSQGRASYTMEPLEYAAAPESMLEALTGM